MTKINFQPIIGLEVHVVINSQTKMFSSAKAQHYDAPNSNIHPIDWGLPGVMPQPNQACIEHAIILAHALKMHIADTICFDRKNYFYPDLPKGFQITQQFYPLGRNGVLVLANQKKIPIARMHLEEDTAKQTIHNGQTYLDYNRCGMPLVEIVTDPVFTNSSEVIAFLKKLRQILLFNQISNAKMEDGSLRVDVNVSLQDLTNKTAYNRVEIKNINAFSSIEKAIDFEIKWQINQIQAKQAIALATKRYNDKTQKNEFLRIKTTAIDYHYMQEPNIAPKKLLPTYIQKLIHNRYVDINQIEQKLSSLNLLKQHISLLMNDYRLYNWFWQIYQKTQNPQETIKWLCYEMVGYCRQNNYALKTINQQQIDSLAALILALEKKQINSKQAKEIVKLIIKTNQSFAVITKQQNFCQINDYSFLKALLQKHFKSNPHLIQQYEQRPKKVENYYIGMVMKDTKGQASPQVVYQILKELLAHEKTNKEK